MTITMTAVCTEPNSYSDSIYKIDMQIRTYGAQDLMTNLTIFGQNIVRKEMGMLEVTYSLTTQIEQM